MKRDRQRPSKSRSSREKERKSPRVAPGTGRGGEEARAPLDQIPRWAPPVVFALLTVILFREFIFSNRMLVGLDTFSLGYAARSFFAAALKTTGFPLWNPQILGGTPFLESLAGGDSLYPPSLLLLYLMETFRALGWKLVLHIFLAGLFMYLWLRTLRVSRSGSLIGGVAYLTAPYLVTLAFPGHDGKIFVTALTPLLFQVTELALTRKGLHWPAAVGGVVAAVILTTHFQMAYFLFGAVGLYALFRTIQEVRRGKSPSGTTESGDRPSSASGDREAAGPVYGHAPFLRFALFLAASLLGAGAAGIQLLPAIDYVTSDSRRTATTAESDGAAARAYSSSWSLHPEEAVSLVVPEFAGANTEQAGAAFDGPEWTSGTYWGRNAFKLNSEYLGLIILLLALTSLLGAPLRGTRIFFVTLGSIAFLFALGAHTPVWRIFYEVVPGISLFRAPSMAIFLTGFALTTLAGLGFDRGVTLLSAGDGKRVLQLTGAVGILLGVGWLAAATGLLTQIWLGLFDSPGSGIQADVLAVAEPFIVRGFFVAFLLAAALLLLWFGVRRGVLPGAAAAILATALVAVDQIRISDGFLGTIEFSQFTTPDTNQRFLIEQAQSEEPFRVFSMIQNGQDVAPAMYGLDLAGGHHPNDLLRYRELIGMQGSGIPEHLATFNPNLLRILNVRYILWPDYQYPIEGAPPVSQITFPDGRPYASVYAFPGLPRARVVGDAVVVPEEEVLDVVLGNHETSYDPFRQTVLAEEPPVEFGPEAATGSVRWLERSPNRIGLEVESTGPALLVLSENWFPGWKATVNGAEVEVLRADYNLRAVPIGAGSQEVIFRYQSEQLRTSLIITLICSLLLISSAGWSLGSRYRR